MLKIFLLISLLFYGVSLAQSDGCSGVPSLTVNQGCVTNNYSLPGTYSDGGLVSSTCVSLNRDDGWYSFVATSTSTRINATSAGGTQALILAAWTSCGGGTQLACTNIATGGSGGLTIGTTVGTTYYIQLHRNSGNNNASMNGTICVIAIPPNDDCTGATTVVVNSGLDCNATSSFSLGGSTTSAQANACLGTADDDVWFRFTASSTSHYIDIYNAGVFNLRHSIYAGTCAAIGAPLICSDPNSSMVSGLTIGNTYYVRIFSDMAGTNTSTTIFTLCITTPPPPPTNDNCTGAIPVAVTSMNSPCNFIAGTIASSTASAQVNGCSGSSDDDVWYSFVAPAGGAIEITLANINNVVVPTDMYISLYGGTCSAIGAPLLCSDPNFSSLTGLSPGSTYFVRVYSATALLNEHPTFNLCIKESSSCGTPLTFDYCVSPIILVPGGNYNGSTAGTFTPDKPANLFIPGFFCGSIENNSWFQFTATASSATFNFTSVNNCSNANGIQAAVFQVAEDANGCCTNFTFMSNCIDQLNSGGIISATGLTVGQTYMLMIDGNAGNQCDYTIANWSPIVLGVFYKGMKVIIEPEGNRVIWETMCEKDNDYFELERSINGTDFLSIAWIDGNGTNAKVSTFTHFDSYRLPGNVYYRIKQVDFNGSINFSDILVSHRLAKDIEIYPNPTDETLFISLPEKGNYEISLADLKGNVIKSIRSQENNPYTFILDLQNIDSGLYYLIFKSPDEGLIQKKVIIK